MLESGDPGAVGMSQLMEIKNLYFRYPSVKKPGQAGWTLSDVSFALQKSSTLGIVGESGSGKSTLIRLMCGLIAKSSGQLLFENRDVAEWLQIEPNVFRTRNQIVFQNPRRSFDPRMTIGNSMSQPIRSLERRIPTSAELAYGCGRVGLAASLLDRFPHQLSGGQLQRVAIARALSVKPNLLFADEPTSALDFSVQAQVLNLLMDLRDELGLTLVLVTHNLAVVGRVAENIIVLKQGVVVDSGATTDVLSNPSNPYTAALVKAAEDVSLIGGGKPLVVSPYETTGH